MAWKVGRDHVMCRHEPRDHAHPVGRITSRAVEQDDRRAVAALEHGGRYAMKLHSSLSDGESWLEVVRERHRRWAIVRCRFLYFFLDPAWPWHPPRSACSAVNVPQVDLCERSLRPRFGETTQFTP